MSTALAQALESLECALLEEETRKDMQRVRLLLAEEFQEFGSSGRVFDREAILRELLSESWKQVQAKNFVCTPLAEGAALLTYHAEREDGVATWRSSVWIWRDARWQMIFHQGTRVLNDS